MKPSTSVIGLLGLQGGLAINHFKGLNTLFDIQELGIVDKDNTILKRTLLSFSHPDCEAQVASLGFPQEFFDVPDAVQEIGQVQLAKPNELNTLFGVSNCNTFVYLPVGKSLTTDFIKKDIFDKEELTSWWWDEQRVSLVVTNDLDYPVSISWEKMDASRRETHLMTVSPRRSERLNTFLGHTFVFRRSDNNELVARKAIINGKDMFTSTLAYGDPNNTDMEPEDTETLQRTEEQVRLWKGRLHSNKERLLQNERQPPSVRKFTKVGFKKMKMLEPAWTQISNFYQDNFDNRILEPWSPDDTHVNFYDKWTEMVYISDEIRELIFRTVKPILEEWSGEELEPTSCYGIRNYYGSSTLREHVDIGRTHIVSAILNVAQKVDKEWPLTILDNEGNRHWVVLEPGDLVPYESATCIHGRPQACEGDYYAGIFTHFKPVRKDWNTKVAPRDMFKGEVQFDVAE